MADRADRRRQPVGRKSRQSQPRKSFISRVTLEKVLGISTVSSSFLTSDPNSGHIAYPAGCVAVLLHPQKNEQTHIINTSRKPFTALDFSHDGKHLVTGESGHMPCVRVWEVGGGQVAEVQAHKYGVSCVAFSSSSCYVVSVGFQHDRTICVWDWRVRTHTKMVYMLNVRVLMGLTCKFSTSGLKAFKMSRYSPGFPYWVFNLYKGVKVMLHFDKLAKPLIEQFYPQEVRLAGALGNVASCFRCS
ncbi:hypothetical protein GOODEAATRI_033324 [Goodea atripinnis]|uniref:Uncharacterized protein n=1 Tax=Goodea atripinnis TaxID=208336 RepID=A0ABV0NZU3_9TELE